MNRFVNSVSCDFQRLFGSEEPKGLGVWLEDPYDKNKLSIEE